MKHFVCTFAEKWMRRTGHTVYTIRVYQIIRNVPVFKAEESDSFTSQDQLFFETAERHKLLPRKALQRSTHTNCRIHSTWSLKEAGIATVTFI